MNIPGESSVLIVGAGPAGLTLANLLGSEGVATVLVERNPGCVPEPRAVALDGESLRALQAVGLADTVLGNIRQGFVADYINGDGVKLFSTDLTARPYGFCLQNTFDQPTLERQLLDGLARFPCVTVAHSTELVSFAQDSDGVTAQLRDGAGNTQALRTGFMVLLQHGHARGSPPHTRRMRSRQRGRMSRADCLGGAGMRRISAGGGGSGGGTVLGGGMRRSGTGEVRPRVLLE